MNGKSARVGLVVALVMSVGMLLTACGEDEPVKVGSVMDFTGDLGEFGGPMNDAVLLAAEHFNAAGGVLGGRDIEVVSEDGATSDVTAVDAARKLVNVDGVSALIGPLGSGITLAVANAVTIPNQVPEISPSATSPALTVLEDDDFIFRTAPSDAFQGVVLANLASGLGYRSAGCAVHKQLVWTGIGRPIHGFLRGAWRAGDGGFPRIGPALLRFGTRAGNR